jgi:hypothetical protein
MKSALLAADAHDQADGNAGDHSVSVVRTDEEVKGPKPAASHGVIGNG